MGKANWRSERISVEKLLDDLRVGVKGQSSWEIARTPRNAFRGSVVIKSLLEVELLIGCGGFTDVYKRQVLRKAIWFRLCGTSSSW